MRGLTRKYFLQKAGNELVGYFLQMNQEIFSSKGRKLIHTVPSFFLNILDNSKQMVSTAISKSLATGTIAPDTRGVNSKHNRLSDKLVEQVVKHICKFKTVSSHYCRQTSQCEYLPQELNVAKMHRMYVQWCEKKKFKPVSKDTYHTIFQEKFCLKFNKPKKDVCDHCQIFLNTTTDQHTAINQA